MFFSKLLDGVKHPVLLRWWHKSVTCSGWRGALALYIAGFCVTLAQPPLYILPLAFLGMALLMARVWHASTVRHAAWCAWCFGFGYFSTGLYWLAYPLLVDAARFGWLIPFAIGGIGGGLALFYALAGGVWAAMRTHMQPWQRFVWLVLCFGSTEWLRGHVLTGFPWNLFGYMWAVSDVTMQAASVLGAYGLTYLSWAVLVLPWFYGTQAHTKASMRVMCSMVAITTVLLSYGVWRVHGASDAVDSSVKFRIVQGNIPQSLKWQPQMRLEAIRSYAALSMMEGYESITHFVWPETAMTFPFKSGDYWAKELAGVLLPHQLLMTGVTRNAKDTQGNEHYYNSLQVMDANAQVLLAYDKIHLVPFGEYVPLRGVLPVEKITQGAVDFSAGKFKHAYHAPNTPPFRPLICYESVFPELSDGVYPAWLLNVTNDAWFGDSVAPHQLLVMSRMRAVEHGVPLIRAANTGISAVIDAYGRVKESLALNKEGKIDAYLPMSLSNSTIYEYIGRWLGVVIALGCVACVWHTRDGK